MTTFSENRGEVADLPALDPCLFYALALRADESLLFGVAATPVMGHGAGRRRKARVSGAWLCSADPAGDGSLLPDDGRSLLATLDQLVGLGAELIGGRAEDAIFRLGGFDTRPAFPVGDPGLVVANLDRKTVDDTARTLGLQRPVAYYADADDLKAFGSLARVEREFMALTHAIRATKRR